MVAIKSKSLDEISAMADQRLPVPGADVAWLVKRVRELEWALAWAMEEIDDRTRYDTSKQRFNCHERAARAILRDNSPEDLAKAEQEDPV